MRVAGPSSLERGLGGWNLPWRSDGTKVRVWSEAGGGVYSWSASPDDDLSTCVATTQPGAVPVAMVSAGRRWRCCSRSSRLLARTRGVP